MTRVAVATTSQLAADGANEVAELGGNAVDCALWDLQARALGLPLLYRKALFDVVALLADGAIAGFVAKRYLAGDGLYYEPRWFKPWPRGLRASIEIAGQRYVLGDGALGGNSSWLGTMYLAALAAAEKMAVLQDDPEAAEPFFATWKPWVDFYLRRRTNYVHAYALTTWFMLAAWIRRRPPAV